MDKTKKIIAHFAKLTSKEALYGEIMSWGKKLLPFDPAWKVEENRVIGCQSVMYLYSYQKESRVFFYATSDALISAGLAALLIEVYNGEPAETILLSPPQFLEELGIPSMLTPGRANGLASLYLKMKQEGLRHLTRISHTFSGNSHTLSPDLHRQDSEAVLLEHCPRYPDDES